MTVYGDAPDTLQDVKSDLFRLIYSDDEVAPKKLAMILERLLEILTDKETDK